MKIYVDSQPLLKNKTGVGYYTYSLIKHLQKEDKVNKYYLIFWRLFFLERPKLIDLINKNFAFKFISWFPFKIYNKLFKLGVSLPLNCFIKKPDIMLFTNFVRFPIWGAKSVIVVYDLSYIKYPQYGDQKNVAFLTNKMSESISKSDHIITISKNSKKEILEYYKVPKEKVSIVYPSFDESLFKRKCVDDISRIKKKYFTGDSYLLFTSTIEPRKNVLNIIKAYRQLNKSIKDKHSLVLVGGKGWQDDDIVSEIDNATKASERIILTGYVPEDDLPVLYSGATVFLYPSLYEGFGIPILEAMACGCPVITSNVTSMPEVAGDAALLVDPHNTDEIKDAITTLVNSKEERKNLTMKGFEQIKKFSWGKSAKESIAIFDKVNNLN